MTEALHMVSTYTDSLINDESALDGHSDSLYQVLTLTAQTYTESLLNDRNAPDGPTYTEPLLNDGSTPDGH